MFSHRTSASKHLAPGRSVPTRGQDMARDYPAFGAALNQTGRPIAAGKRHSERRHGTHHVEQRLGPGSICLDERKAEAWEFFFF